MRESLSLTVAESGTKAVFGHARKFIAGSVFYVFPRANSEWAHREIDSEEAAREGLHNRQGCGLSALHFRHTCLTRWRRTWTLYTLGYLAGHSDFSTTKRYVHPQAQTVLAAMERARAAQSPHKNGHNANFNRLSHVA